MEDWFAARLQMARVVDAMRGSTEGAPEFGVRRTTGSRVISPVPMTAGLGRMFVHIGNGVNPATSVVVLPDARILSPDEQLSAAPPLPAGWVLQEIPPNGMPPVPPARLVWFRMSTLSNVWTAIPPWWP